MQISHFWHWEEIGKNEWQNAMESFAACGHRSLAVRAEQALRIALDPPFLRYLKKISAAAGVSFDGVHAPFSEEWDLLCDDADFAPVSSYVHSRLLEILPDEFGINTYTMHLKNELFTGTQQEADELFMRKIEPLLKIAERKGVVIAIENGFQPVDCPENIGHYIESVNSPALGICLDVGHLNVFAHRNDRKIMEYITPLLQHVVVCHLHDNDGAGDRHWIPGQGTLDWKSCMPHLAAAPRLRSLQNESCSVGVTIKELCETVDSTLIAAINSGK